MITVLIIDENLRALLLSCSLRAKMFLAASAAALLLTSAVAQQQQCTQFAQITGGVSPIVASPSNVWVYALPDDCPKACTICSAGCLFCANSGYSGAGAPPADLPYNPKGEGSWLALDTSAQGAGGACLPGMHVGARTGSLVAVDGLTGTFSATTGTRVSSKTSSCGDWTVVNVTPLPPAPPGGYLSPPPAPPLPASSPPLPPALYDWQLPDAKLTPGEWLSWGGLATHARCFLP